MRCFELWIIYLTVYFILLYVFNVCNTGCMLSVVGTPGSLKA